MVPDVWALLSGIYSLTFQYAEPSLYVRPFGNVAFTVISVFTASVSPLPPVSVAERTALGVITKSAARCPASMEYWFRVFPFSSVCATLIPTWV